MSEREIITGDVIQRNVRRYDRRAWMAVYVFVLGLSLFLVCTAVWGKIQKTHYRFQTRHYAEVDMHAQSDCWQIIQRFGDDRFSPHADYVEAEESTNWDRVIEVGVFVLYQHWSHLVMVSSYFQSADDEARWLALDVDCRLDLLRETVGEVEEKYAEVADDALIMLADPPLQTGIHPSKQTRGYARTEYPGPWWVGPILIGFPLSVLVMIVSAASFIVDGMRWMKWAGMRGCGKNCPMCRYELMEREPGKRFCPECGFWCRVGEHGM